MVYLLSFVRLQREEMILQCSMLCQTTVCAKFFYLWIYHSFMFQARNKTWLIIVAGEEVVTALGSEVDRLEKEIQELVPGIQHVDIEAHNPIDQSLWSETFFQKVLSYRYNSLGLKKWKLQVTLGEIERVLCQVSDWEKCGWWILLCRVFDIRKSHECNFKFYAQQKACCRNVEL